ncbi:MAG: c-type cytochrome [Verrucomicrobiales bacterium]|nr:c-type cytochrome [Verrucomicrobiales bacterium]
MIRPRWPVNALPFRLSAGVFALLGLTTLLAADVPVAVPVPTGARMDAGELLLGELNCVACHAAPLEISARLQSRTAPRLGTEGLRLTPQWIRSWLSNPAASKPGTAMPDLLHGLPAAEQADAIESLTQFLVSIQPAGAPDAVSADPARAAIGQTLYHSLGCVACHAPFERGAASAEVLAAATARSIPLGDLARKYPAGELARFLRSPALHRPSGRMPSFNLTATEASDLAVYLLREQLAGSTAAKSAPVGGLKWDLFEGEFHRCADLARKEPVASGTTDRITAEPARRENNFGLRFSGGLEIATAGDYTFWASSDDGSQIRVDDRLVVNNDGEHGGNTVSGTVALTPGFHSLEILFFQLGGGFEFSVEWSGPGFQRQPIPPGVLKHFARPLVPLGQGEFTGDPARAARGRDWFAKLNCGACHAGKGLPEGRPATPLPSLKAKATRGCLAETVSVGIPRYTLSVPQRDALRTTVAHPESLASAPSPALQVESTLTRLNCYACHSRDGLGGPVAEGRSDWFQVVGEADLGDEGRIPPALTGVGAKLKPAWLNQVLREGTKVRPYMATRMPVFGSPALESLPAQVRAADRNASAPADPAVTTRDAKFGWKLVGTDGLSCVACHTFAQYPSLGIPALGLGTLGQRLEWDWFRRYLPDPAALRPGTRMPSFWPEGHAVNDSLLGGNTDAQIQAIWAYLAAGDKAEVPTGLVRGRQELIPAGEPEIYRNFIAGAGSRAIGVGYPEKANLAFDAATLRPALVWQGSFMDTARHSTGRGEGFEPPLGDHPVSLPPGPPFAILPDGDASWPTETGTAAGYQFSGYRFDAKRRPVFLYRFRGISIEDAFAPKPGDVDMTFVRTLRFTGASPGPVWFRAATGTVTPGPEGTWLVNGTLRLRFRGGAGEARIVQGELRIPVAVPGELVEEITW